MATREEKKKKNGLKSFLCRMTPKNVRKRYNVSSEDNLHRFPPTDEIVDKNGRVMSKSSTFPLGNRSNNDHKPNLFKVDDVSLGDSKEEIDKILSNGIEQHPEKDLDPMQKLADSDLVDWNLLQEELEKEILEPSENVKVAIESWRQKIGTIKYGSDVFGSESTSLHQILLQRVFLESAKLEMKVLHLETHLKRILLEQEEEKKKQKEEILKDIASEKLEFPPKCEDETSNNNNANLDQGEENVEKEEKYFSSSFHDVNQIYPITTVGILALAGLGLAWIKYSK